MKAKDIMTRTVITVEPNADVREIAKTLLSNRISAVPVVDGRGALVGIVSEGDLMRRPESQTERHPSWWLSLLLESEQRALNYVKSHGLRANDVMTSPVITIDEDASLETIADLLERNHIKRVPVVRGNKLVGIVSRANLLHGLTARHTGGAPSSDDNKIRETIETTISDLVSSVNFVNIVVSGGIVHIWGLVMSQTEKDAVRIAAESAQGVKEVRNNVGVIPANVRTMLWAE